MNGSLRSRLALSYLLVVLICMGMIAPLAWLAVEQLYRQTQGANLLAQAQLIASAMSGSSLQMADPVPYSQTTNTLSGIHTRVIDAQGAAVIDLLAPGDVAPSSPVSLPQLAQNAAGIVTAEELLTRPEIAQARRGQAATAVRRVDVAGGKPVLYAAAPILSANGSVAQIVYLATPLPDTQWAALPLAIRSQFVGVVLVAFILAGGMGWLLARRIARPLGHMAAAAHAIAGGDLGQSVPEERSITELAVLGRAFNSMSTSLRQSDQAKNAFVADVSHELRTPLTVIKGTIETLQDGAIDDRAVRDTFLGSMNQETDRLIRLVNDLLVLTRADAGALNLHLHSVEMAGLASARCAQKQRIAHRRRVKLCVDPASPPDNRPGECALADADRIAQVLDNLLDNAIRFSPDGGVVKISIDREGDRIACRVNDAGPGIPSRHLPHIFERFYRADPARDRDRGGSGLGLAIVRGLVAAHGGQVEASSTEGQGTTITFWLPAAQTGEQTDTHIPSL